MGERIIDLLDEVQEELLAERALTAALREQLRIADETHRNDLLVAFKQRAAERLLRQRKERRMHGNVRDRVRSWLFHLLPELRNDVGNDAVNVVAEAKSKLDTLLSVVQRLTAMERIVTVALLLPDATTVEQVDESLPEDQRKPRSFAIPCFQSWHARVDRGPRLYNSVGDGSREIEVPIETYWKIPKGSWLVVHGATFSRAYAGAYALDRGPGGVFCRIEEDVPRGVRIVVFAKID